MIAFSYAGARAPACAKGGGAGDFLSVILQENYEGANTIMAAAQACGAAGAGNCWEGGGRTAPGQPTSAA